MRSLPVVVNIHVPAYRDGLVTAFADAGFPTEAPEHVEEWMREEGRRGLLMSVDGPDDCATLARLRTIGTDAVILALLGTPTSDFYTDALRHGASAAVAWDASVDTILRAFRAALDHQCIIPLAVAQVLVGGRPDSGTTVLEERWLSMIAAGSTIGEVACEAGYPERDMLQVLHDLYDRLGLSSSARPPE